MAWLDDDQLGNPWEIAMRVHSNSTVWTIECVIDEDADQTEVKAILRVGDWEVGGWGRAQRAPKDPDRPRIGEQLAVARALADLSHKLVDAATSEIEEFEGQRVEVHR